MKLPNFLLLLNHVVLDSVYYFRTSSESSELYKALFYQIQERNGNGDGWKLVYISPFRAMNLCFRIILINQQLSSSKVFKELIRVYLVSGTYRLKSSLILFESLTIIQNMLVCNLYNAQENLTKYDFLMEKCEFFHFYNSIIGRMRI